MSDAARPDEVWVGDNLLVFDGTVLEVFGHPATPSARWHVRALEIEVGEPDRHARRLLRLRATARFSGGLGLEIPPEDWPAAEALLGRVLAAMPD